MDEVLGHYHLLRELGRGGMGIVYLAFDDRIERNVAIKTIPLDTDPEGNLHRALLREARAAGRLNHPNIVVMYQVGQEKDRLYLAMEYVAGGSLDRRLTPDQPADPTWTVAILRQIAAALDAAHAAHIVHRDIKPSNILLTEHNDQVKVADFGLARTFVSGASQTLVAGTPVFMSPEQTKGEQLDGRSDQFALAVLAYRMLSGKLPFNGENLVALAYQIVHAVPSPVHIVNPALSVRVSDALARGLAKQRERRYASCTEFVESLVDALAGGKTETRVYPPPVPPLEPPGKSWLLRLTSGVTPWLLLLSLGAATVVGYLLWRQSRIPAPSSASTAAATPPQRGPRLPSPEEKPKITSEPNPEAQISPQTPAATSPKPPASAPAVPVENPKPDPQQAQEIAEASGRLISAIQRREGPAVLNALLERRADPSAGLHAAAAACREDVVRLLLGRGANANWVHPTWNTSVLSAALSPGGADPAEACAAREGIVDLLLASGARASAGPSDDTVLADAAALGVRGLPIVKKLLSTGVMPRTALRRATATYFPPERDCDTSVVEALLFAGARPDADADRYQKTALMEAAARKCLAIVTVLLEHGARADRPDAEGRTALYYAIKEGSTSAGRPLSPVVRKLIEAGAKPNQPVSKAVGGGTPFLEACRAEVPVLQLLLDSGADIDSVNNLAETCLHIAVSSQQIRRIDLLLSRKANVNARDERGITPLGVARSIGFRDSHEIVRRLLAAGATE